MSDQILEQFKKTLISFLDELISQFSNDSELIFMRIMVKDQISTKKLMNHFLLKLVEGREKIKERNDEIFKSDFFTFGKINGLKRIKQMWIRNEIHKDDKETIWTWLDVIVILCDKYTKND